MSSNLLSERALSLLSSGVSPVQVAAACGVTESAISQLVSNPEFSAALTLAKYENLQRHNARDNKYDILEDKLIDSLERNLPLMMRPLEILKALQVINGAKRRGQSAPDQVVQQQNIVSIQMPTLIVNKFTTNISNQVINASGQELLTIQSGALLKQVKGAENDELSKRAQSSNSLSFSKGSSEEAVTIEQGESRAVA